MNCCKDKKSIEEITILADFLRAIAEDNRLKILCLLKEGEKCVCEIWQYLELSQNLTSHHLKVLKGSSLVDSRKDGLKIFYSLNEKTLDVYKKQLDKYLSIKQRNNK